MRNHVKNLMSKWPSYAQFARDIGIKPSHAEVMKVRKSIPPEYWLLIEVAARKRRIPGITVKTLAAMHTKRKLAS